MFSIKRHSVQIIPAILVCSGKVSVLPGAKREIYSNPYVKIRTTPTKKIRQSVEWYDDVSITVPIFFNEATQERDSAKFTLQVIDEKNERKWSDIYISKDTYCRFDQFRKALRVILPVPSDDEKKNTIKYTCNIGILLDVEDRKYHVHRAISTETSIGVGIKYLKDVSIFTSDFVVYAGIHVKTDFEPKLTREEWEELIWKKKYEDWMWKRELNDRISYLEVDEE